MRNHSEEQADEWIENRKRKERDRKWAAKRFYDNLLKFDLIEEFVVGNDGRYHYVYIIEDSNPSSKSKCYIGSRSSEVSPMDDEYMGSSTMLKREIEKRPGDFQKKIVCCCDTVRESRLTETDLILEKKAHDDDIFYNGLDHKAKSDTRYANSKGRRLSKEEILEYEKNLMKNRHNG